MRTKSAIAAFVALGAMTGGVQALNTVNTAGSEMKGSDTIKQVTLDVIAACEANSASPRISPAGSIKYIGTGSSNGQANIANSAILTVTSGAVTETPVQTIAPMSRALNASACVTAPASSTAGVPFDMTGAEGLVFALDGMTIVGARASTSATGCNSTTPVDACVTDAASPGLRSSGTIAGTTTAITDWKTALRILYLGATLNSDDPTKGAQRDCNSAARQALANSWDEVFQGNCAACDDPVNPNQVRHLYRRDDESGTTDAFLAALGVGGINFAVADTSTATNTYLHNMANSAFCNVKRPGDTYGIPLKAQPHADPGTWDDASNPNFPRVAPYYSEFQEMDPIRRPCVGTGNLDSVTGLPPAEATEQVCGPKGDLGLVLPINPPPVDAASPTPYPTKYCETGRFRLAPALRNATNGVVGIWCPNGDAPLGTSCYYPTATDGDFACINSKQSVPGARVCNGGSTVPSTCVSTEGLANIVALTAFTGLDGRTYNLHLKTGSEGGVGAGAYQTIKRPNPAAPTGTPISVPVHNAYYRIHATRTLHTPFTNGCQQADATRQIGCLPLASHCSLGFAGNEAVSANPGAAAMRVNGILPDDQCVKNLVSSTPVGNPYPLARKLYVNSIRGLDKLNRFGFTAAPTTIPSLETAPDNEQDLVRCFVSVGSAKAVANGFTALPENGGQPFCEDFNELALCATGVANVNACANNGGVIPNNAAYCGDGIVQAPEQCDDGNIVDDDGVGGDVCSNGCVTKP